MGRVIGRSYGVNGGIRAVEQLRQVAGVLHLADVTPQVSLQLFTEFENMSVFKPAAYNLDALNEMLGDVVSWSAALPPLRAVAAASAS